MSTSAITKPAKAKALSTREAVELTGIVRQTLRRHFLSGRLRATYGPHGLEWNEADLIAYKNAPRKNKFHPLNGAPEK
jgi:hypothetical protein